MLRRRHFGEGAQWVSTRPILISSGVEETARCPLFLFVKEDENLYPKLDYSPVRQRTEKAVAGIARAREVRGRSPSEKN